MDPELVAALQPILKDLAGPAGVLPEVRDEPWQDYERTASAILYEADGSGTGVFIHLGSPFSAQVAALAEQVQDWAVEALCALERSTSWPPCPEHPDRHPLAAVEQAGRAVWVCPVTGTEVGEVGTLTT
ncbi:hypothetical protein [Actinoplanes xinjiangensis]|uniref:Uncharacterized protein n=1 Tax=Actinoplanes xinjiangensis TaxID=512350 RepID=A0A316FYM1_9ACTN|nr:hypothetical protein [Actinoplanes xinjiangensis]PWK47227.1 hypothetical protein BC793_108342 [Actinoplanes xinjiangensis]